MHLRTGIAEENKRELLMDRKPARPSEEVKAENNGELLMDRPEVKENKKEVLMDRLPIRPQ